MSRRRWEKDSFRGFILYFLLSSLSPAAFFPHRGLTFLSIIYATQWAEGVSRRWGKWRGMGGSIRSLHSSSVSLLVVEGTVYFLLSLTVSGAGSEGYPIQGTRQQFEWVVITVAVCFLLCYGRVLRTDTAWAPVLTSWIYCPTFVNRILMVPAFYSLEETSPAW